MEAKLALTVAFLFALGAGMILLRRRGRVSRAEWGKYAVYALLIPGLLMLAHMGRPWVAAVVVLVAARGVLELRLAFDGRLGAARAFLAFAGLAVALGHLLLGPGRTWFASFALLLLLVAATDAFAQLSGRLLGRHPLCPRISPGKTVEGLIGGLIAAPAVAAALAFLSPEWTPLRRTALAAITALAAVAGDLLFSAIKRRAGIKDFAVALPGHGGVLDRFDSLVVAAPLHVWARLVLSP